VTLLEALEPPSMLPSNSLSPDSVARLVNAAIVEATPAVELAVELEVLLVLAVVFAEVAAAAVFAAAAALEALKRLYRAEAWLLPTLPIDITTSIAVARIRAIGRGSKHLRRSSCGNVRTRFWYGFVVPRCGNNLSWRAICHVTCQL
jgi:hypothetical protein